jgi:hypothetical protein
MIRPASALQDHGDGEQPGDEDPDQGDERARRLAAAAPPDVQRAEAAADDQGERDQADQEGEQPVARAAAGELQLEPSCCEPNQAKAPVASAVQAMRLSRISRLMRPTSAPSR